MPFSFLTSGIFLWVYLINIVLSFIVIFFERKNPASTWAWLLVFIYLPVVGFCVYLIFGRNAKKERMFMEKYNNDSRFLKEFLENNNRYSDEIFNQRKISENKDPILPKSIFDDAVYLNINSDTILTNNNKIQVFGKGDDKFNSLMNDMKNAKKFIHFEYYIIRDDKLGNAIMKLLAQKAREGVCVRVLYDGMGCRKVSKTFFDELKEAGGNVEMFLPPNFTRINFRNHRKIVVVDGEIGYVGGFNVGDEYLGLVKRFGNWRDSHLRICGDAVDFLNIVFLNDWNFTSKKNKAKITTDLFPAKENIKGTNVQIVSSGPDVKRKRIKNSIFKIMTRARKNIYIATPYFVPDDSIMDALKTAARSGVDVRVIIPANPDHPFVYWTSMSYLGELLDSGVKCYQYKNGFIHSKVISVDGYASTIGTSNFDIRSFDLNFEVNAFIFDEEVSKEIERNFLEDLLSCEEMDMEKYNNRGNIFKIREGISRLFSPML